MGRFEIHFRSGTKHIKAPRKYTFENRRGWTHHDLTHFDGLHFVMYGALGRPMVLIKFKRERSNGIEQVTIEEIQRASKKRYSYILDEETGRELHRADIAIERKKHKKAKTELDTHTSEFALREFIFRERKKLIRGKTEILFHPPLGDFRIIFNNILRKYFKKTEEKNTWTLDFDKPQVRKVLGLEPI